MATSIAATTHNIDLFVIGTLLGCQIDTPSSKAGSPMLRDPGADRLVGCGTEGAAGMGGNGGPP
jgi:hypothetical protein